MASDGPVVRTSAGAVRGRREHGSAVFLGVPYAAPPVGPLAFAAPQPRLPWTGVRDATRFGPTAQQRVLGGYEATTVPEPVIDGDDVLTVNVWTPDTGARLPVLVWIHGGGYFAGSPASPWWDGRAFTRDGVVVVTIGYRLGIPGFLAVDGGDDLRGVRDWIAALTWVRDEIAAFGGDPGRVTVAGQSAGAGAVLTLFATPAARGLFRAGVALSPLVQQPDEPAVAGEVARLLTARTGVPARADALGALDRAALLALQDRLMAPGADRAGLPDLPLAPLADGRLVPLPVLDAFRDGTAAPVPLLLGSTRDEFIGEPFAAATDADALLERSGLPEPPAAAGTAGAERAGRLMTELLFRLPALAVAEARRARSEPTWLYEFAWAARGDDRPGLAFHCLDLPFAFDVLDAERVTRATGPEPPRSLADDLHGALVAFVRDLDPGAAWPSYGDDRAVRVLDAPSSVRHDPFRADRRLLGAVHAG